MSPKTRLLATLVPCLFAAGAAWSQTVCPVAQVTDTASCLNFLLSVDGGSVAFESTCDLTGGNPDLNQEIFLFDGTAFVQVTATSGCTSRQPSLSGSDIAFLSDCDLTGGNPGGQLQVFVFDGSTFSQVTAVAVPLTVFSPSADAGGVAFVSGADLAGNNADGNLEVFLFDGVTISQVTDSAGCQNAEPSLEAGAVAFRSDCDLTGGNADGNIEVFLFDGVTISQVTATSGCGSFFLSPGNVDLDGGIVTFGSNCDLTGGNADANSEIFLFDGVALAQVTSTGGSGCSNFAPRLDGGVVAYQSSCTGGGDTHVLVADGTTITDATAAASGCPGGLHDLGGGVLALISQCDLTGANPDGGPELFVGTCGPASVVEVPAAGPAGLAALALLLVGAGWFALRRRPA